ncbi:hypothetical protein BGX38DRAFT_1276403 [Terfezia claveryi]|nr:hypothetical protein BGX38DRAFT_1276403 [Terfezia claveryi]
MAQPAHPPQAPHFNPHDYLHPNPHPSNPPSGIPRYNIPPPPANNSFLNSLILRTLKVTATDGRWFVGVLKCTDKDRNLILERTQEYRAGKDEGRGATPSASTTTTTTTTTTTATTEGSLLMEGPEGSVEISAGGEVGERNVGGVTSRFLGLVVVPGEVIVKVEVEEKKGGLGSLGGGEII